MENLPDWMKTIIEAPIFGFLLAALLLAIYIIGVYVKAFLAQHAKIKAEKLIKKETSPQSQLGPNSRNEAISGRGNVQISQPKDGERLELMEGESMPISRIVKGIVQESAGTDPLRFPLEVQVHILTDRWYPQGVTRLESPGNWEIGVHYGGLHHTVKAVLLDSDGAEIDAQTRIVTIYQ